MPYVPGYQQDVFVSYAHGDDREWIARLVDRLDAALAHRLGVKGTIWIDDAKLRASRDFSREIPEAVRSSAVLLVLASPTYIRSRYCIDQECRVFGEAQTDRRTRFATPDFANDLFALRCPILPIDGNEHWSLFPGLTDIPFCDESDTYAVGTPQFDASFSHLVGETVGLLKRMRNHSTAVFLHPPQPGADLKATRQALADELTAQSYRVLPDRTVNLSDQLREAALSVFLLGAEYDDAAGELAEVAAGQPTKPWVVWCSPAVEQQAPADQVGLCSYLDQLDSPTKTYLNGGIGPAKLKEEVLALLRPDSRVVLEARGKPLVYLVYNARDRAEVKNAGLISYHFRKQADFEHPDDPAQHTLRLSHSDGVLLVWGNAAEDWCSREFAEMVQTSRRAGAKGLCLFNPADSKTAAVQTIREAFHNLYVGEEFGKFDPARLQTFFTALSRRSSETPS